MKIREFCLAIALSCVSVVGALSVQEESATHSIEKPTQNVAVKVGNSITVDLSTLGGSKFFFDTFYTMCHDWNELNGLQPFTSGNNDITDFYGSGSNAGFYFINGNSVYPIYNVYINSSYSLFGFTMEPWFSSGFHSVTGFYIQRTYDDTLHTYFYNCFSTLNGISGYTLPSYKIRVDYSYNTPEPLGNKLYEDLDYYLINDGQSDYEGGKTVGFELGYNTAKNEFYDSRYELGKADGRAQAIEEYASVNTTTLQIFTGIVDVGLLPINVFLAMFNYEVFGINIRGLVSGLLTIAIVVIVIRLVTGKKDD